MSREGVRRFDLDGLYTVRWDAGCCVFFRLGAGDGFVFDSFFPFSSLLIGIVTK